MGYFLDETKFSCEQIVQRIRDTDLIPSLESLKAGIQDVMDKFAKDGVGNLRDLRTRLKSKAKLSQVSAQWKIDESYLVLLRREVEGWIAKVRGMEEWDWISESLRDQLVSHGITNSEEAYCLLSTEQGIEKYSRELGVPKAVLEEIAAISDLLRVRWLSPAFTRVLHELGYTVARLKKADPRTLTEEIDRCNKEKQYYKGKVGERDIKRILFECQFV